MVLIYNQGGARVDPARPILVVKQDGESETDGNVRRARLATSSIFPMKIGNRGLR